MPNMAMIYSISGSNWCQSGGLKFFLNDYCNWNFVTVRHGYEEAAE